MPEESEPATTPVEEPKTYTQEQFKRALAEQGSKLKEQYGDYDDLKAKAAQFDEAAEAQKSEAQKAIDAANKERDDALALVTKTQREVALSRLPEDKREKYAEASVDVITALAEELAATPPVKNEPDPSDGRPRLNLRAGEPEVVVRTRDDIKKAIDSIPRR